MRLDNKEISTALNEIAADAQNRFGALAPAQIKWKPSAEEWSVGQCFEHLIKSNALFFDELEAIAVGTRRSSWLEKVSPLSSFFGKVLINSLKKDERKFKAPTRATVPPSEIAADIVARFVAHQTELVGKIERTANADWNKTVVTSPFMKLMTYKLADGFQVIVEHERRHIRQAARVTETAGFPSN